MSLPINIEEYVHGWLAPVSLERLFADSLKSDPRLARFKPREIEPKKGSKVTASNVGGALSTLIVGIGWRNVRVPTSILVFDSCPIRVAVFGNHENSMKAGFFFPIPSHVDPGKWGFWKGTMNIRRKGAGIFGSGRSDQMEFKPLGNFSPAIEEMKADQTLAERLLAFAMKGLIKTVWICTVSYDTRGGHPTGEIKFEIDHGKKKWKSALQEQKFRPEDYVFDLFNNACSIIEHVEEYFAKNF